MTELGKADVGVSLTGTPSGSVEKCPCWRLYGQMRAGSRSTATEGRGQTHAVPYPQLLQFMLTGAG